MLSGFLTAVPWFIPGVVVAIVVGVLARRPAAAWLRSSELVAFLTIVAFGMILAATLTPLHETTSDPSVATACDLSRIGLAPRWALRRLNDTSLNILLFIPLGLMLSLLPRSPHKAALIVVAVALPLAIELIQLVVVPIDRACQSADVFDNLTGLVIGLAVGAVLGLIGSQVGADPERPGSR